MTTDTTPPVVFLETTAFWWPVTAHVPNDGGMAERLFEARFKFVDDTEIDTVMLGSADQRDAVKVEREFLARNIIGLRGITQPDGSDVTVEQLVFYTPYRRALVTAFMEAHSGRARTGN